MCWSPYFIFNLMGVYHLIPINSSTMGLHSLVQSLAPLNSAANPIIYGVFSTRICRQLRWVVLCCVLQYLIEVTFKSASSVIYLFGIDVETGSLFWCFPVLFYSKKQCASFNTQTHNNKRRLQEKCKQLPFEVLHWLSAYKRVSFSFFLI